MGNWDLNPTYRCYNPIHTWSKPILNALSRISHEHEWIFFQVLLRSLTKYKVDWDTWSLVLSCHVTTFTKLSFINYWQTWTNRHQQFQQNSPEFPMESPDILWLWKGPMTLISPPTWSWEASGFAPLVGRIGLEMARWIVPGQFLEATVGWPHIARGDDIAMAKLEICNAWRWQGGIFFGHFSLTNLFDSRFALANLWLFLETIMRTLNHFDIVAWAALVETNNIVPEKTMVGRWSFLLDTGQLSVVNC